MKRQGAFEALRKATYMSVTTYRRSGVAVVTPVWFAETDGVLYFETGHDSGKMKRIRNNPRVLIGPCTASGKLTGETLDARATEITDAAEKDIALAGLRRKYRGIRQVYYFINATAQRLRGKPPEQSALCRVVPILN